MWLINDGGEDMDPEIANIIAGVLILVGAVIAGGAVYAGLEKVANAINDMGKIPEKDE
jgi:phosphate/sulfate permease